jgi:hypothetical protein
VEKDLEIGQKKNLIDMIGFIKFGLAKNGAIFPICEVLFLLDILAFLFNLENVWTWISFVMLGLYNIIMLIEYEERI